MLITYLGEGLTLTVRNTKRMRLLLLAAKRNGNKKLTLSRRVFPVTIGCFRTFTENGDCSANPMRNSRNMVSKSYTDIHSAVK